MGAVKDGWNARWIFRQFHGSFHGEKFYGEIQGKFRKPGDFTDKKHFFLYDFEVTAIFIEISRK